MDIKQSGSQASTKGPAEYFTGTVRIDPLFQANDPALGRRQCHVWAWCPYRMAHPPLGPNPDRDIGLRASYSSGEAQPRKFGRVTWSGSRRARSIGTVPRRPRPWRTLPFRNSSTERPSTGWKRSATINTVPPWLHAGTNIMNNNNIEGKVVVDHGPRASGLGESTARLLSAQGASVVLGARRVNRLRSLVRRVDWQRPNMLCGPYRKGSPGSKALQHPHYGNLAWCGSHGTTEHHDRDGYRRESPQVVWIAIPAESFARAVAFAISQPDEMDVNEILFRPTCQML